MLKTLDVPCWHLTNADGTDYDPGEGTQHFDTEKEATDHAEGAGDRHCWPEVGPTLTPRQWPQACVLIVCDDCGADPDDDAWAHVHFPDEGVAESMASVYDYEIAEVFNAAGTLVGKKVLCPDCVWKRDLAAEDADDEDE
jgi:hypothetical protein